MPKLSFVIPYYEKERTLSKCLNSLFDMGVKDIEVIVVFDGPDVAGSRIVRKFLKKHSDQMRVVNIEHGGAPAARNAGAEVATGEYIVFWDADCYIEPGAAQVWLQAFNKYPEVDFVYSGYRFEEGARAMESEPFDPWLLKVNNYISGCFPIKREKAPKWDTMLRSLQDWDFWLTAVENGCKGFFMRGYAFKTDYPDKKSISGMGCAPQNWLSRLETVKRKHNIPLRVNCISNLSNKVTGIKIAKILDADYRDYPLYFPNRYKRVIQIGFDVEMANVHAGNFHNRYGEQPERILFWSARNAHALRYKAAVAATEALAMTINKTVNHQFCEDKETQEYLARLGFLVKVLPLPIDFADEELKPLPETFKMLIDIDSGYKNVVDSIKRAMPDVEFTELTGSVNIDDYSAVLRFHSDRGIDESAKKVLLAGRRVISNIQAPFCGFISDVDGAEVARANIIAAIRAIQDERGLHLGAVDYYRGLCSPDKFKADLEAALVPDEVVA